MSDKHPERSTIPDSAVLKNPVSSLTRPQWRPGSGCGDGPNLVRGRRHDQDCRFQTDR